MFQVENCALTCANQTSGSVGKKGGILIDTEVTMAGTGCGGFSDDSWSIVDVKRDICLLCSR